LSYVPPILFITWTQRLLVGKKTRKNGFWQVVYIYLLFLVSLTNEVFSPTRNEVVVLSTSNPVVRAVSRSRDPPRTSSDPDGVARRFEVRGR